MSFGGSDNGSAYRAQLKTAQEENKQLSSQLATERQTATTLRSQLATNFNKRKKQNENNKISQLQQQRKNRQRFLLTGNPTYNNNVNINDEENQMKRTTLGNY